MTPINFAEVNQICIGGATPLIGMTRNSLDPAVSFQPLQAAFSGLLAAAGSLHKLTLGWVALARGLIVMVGQSDQDQLGRVLAGEGLLKRPGYSFNAHITPISRGRAKGLAESLQRWHESVVTRDSCAAERFCIAPLPRGFCFLRASTYQQLRSPDRIARTIAQCDIVRKL